MALLRKKRKKLGGKEKTEVQKQNRNSAVAGEIYFIYFISFISQHEHEFDCE
jgi:hypothetical protein